LCNRREGAWNQVVGKSHIWFLDAILAEVSVVSGDDLREGEKSQKIDTSTISWLLIDEDHGPIAIATDRVPRGGVYPTRLRGPKQQIELFLVVTDFLVFRASIQKLL